MRNGKLRETPDGRVYDTEAGYEVKYNFFFQAWVMKYPTVSAQFTFADEEKESLLNLFTNSTTKDDK